VLRREHPDAYAAIAPESKARILIDTLKHTESADDWSFMYDREPRVKPRNGEVKERGVDYVAAQALVEIPCQVTLHGLIEVLQDERESLWSGSAETWQSIDDHLRRCDLAYRYICIQVREKPKYARSVKRRDQAIAELMKKLHR